MQELDVIMICGKESLAGMASVTAMTTVDYWSSAQSTN